MYPYVAYDNATFVLPNWNKLSAYACNTNGPTSTCESDETQVPLLSWTSDGVFYVNSADNLIFYSLVNATAYTIAPWTPLYQNTANYQEEANTEWITSDGSIVWTWGCLSVCTSSSTLTTFAVNVTTGAHYEHNWTGITDTNVLTNGESDIVGVNGAHADFSMITESWELYLWNIANNTQWVGGSFAYFEANNDWFVPMLNSWFDMSAGGSTNDQVIQYKFSGTGISNVWEGYWAPTGTVTTNAAYGAAYNVTSRTVYIDAGGDGVSYGAALQVGTQGIVTAIAYTKQSSTQYSTIAVSEKRGEVYSWGDLIGIQYYDTLGNASWVYNPGSAYSSTGYVDTNMPSYGPLSTAGGTTVTFSQSWFTYEAQGANASYSISGSSVICSGLYGEPGKCALSGTDTGTSSGTIYYIWQANLPEFPEATSSPKAEPYSPSVPTSVSATGGSTSVTLTWSAPASGWNPGLNYTLLWGTSTAYSHTINLQPDTTSFIVTGLSAGNTIYFSLTPWNFHWSGPTAIASATVVTPGVPSPPHGLGASSVTTTTVPLSWTNPSGTLTGDIGTAGNRHRVVRNLHLDLFAWFSVHNIRRYGADFGL